MLIIVSPWCSKICCRTLTRPGSLAAHHLGYPSRTSTPVHFLIPMCYLLFYSTVRRLYGFSILRGIECFGRARVATLSIFDFSTALLTDSSCAEGSFSQFLGQLLRPWGRFISYAHDHHHGSLPTTGSVSQFMSIMMHHDGSLPKSIITDGSASLVIPLVLFTLFSFRDLLLS